MPRLQLQELDARLTPALAYALTDAQLVAFDPDAPANTSPAVAISGLQPGEQLLGLDFRPATGALFALGSTSRLYAVSPQTGLATQVGTGPFPVLLDGTTFGFDFNPVADRIRVVSDTGQNFRINPNTGAQVDSDPVTAGVQLDGNLNGPISSVTATAYTNNFAGTTTTTQYTLDPATDSLYIQNPPNSGTQSLVGTLGIDFTATAGFDISAEDGRAFAALVVGGATKLYTLTLATGSATLAGAVPVSTTALAIQAQAVTLFGTDGNNLVRINSTNPSVGFAPVPITGLLPAETVLGVDVRPVTGAIYALGSSSRLYIINPADGVATQVGSGSFSVPLVGTNFGFDFNPTVDRIRVVSDAGTNFRLNPDTGTVVDSQPTVAGVQLDGPINGPVTGIGATAYSNNVANVGATTQYTLDGTTDSLYIQNPPNSGTQTLVGALGVDFSSVNGFDIVAGTNTALAGLTVAGVTGLYRVNLTTGSATRLGTLGTGSTPLTGLTALPVGAGAYGLDSGGNLAYFNLGSPGVVLFATAVTGLGVGEVLLALDQRPATGNLYALGSAGQLYLLDPDTGVATALGGPLDVLLNGIQFGFDFNPTVDRIRVVSSAGQNLRINPDTGLVVDSDPLVPGTQPDNNLTGATTAATGAAYTSNFAGTASTLLFVLDSVSDALYLQAPPNQGVLTKVGDTGVDFGSVFGFDITPGNVAYAPLSVGGQPQIYVINLSTGAASPVGRTEALSMLAVLPSEFDSLPRPTPDTYATRFNQPLTVAVDTGVLANDVAGVGRTLTAQVVTAPTAAQGTLALAADGSFVFTPAANFVGTATFVYRATDGVQTSVPVTASIIVPADPATQELLATANPGVVNAYTADKSGNYNPSTPTANYTPFDGAGTPRVAVGDVTGDGVGDLVFVTGPGGGAFMRIIDGATNENVLTTGIIDTFPGENLTDIGLFVAVGDIDGDGKAEVAISPDQGGGPRIKIFSANAGGLVLRQDFLGIEDPAFRGGARVALGDLNGDARADLLVGAGFQGGPRIALWNGTTLATNTPVKLVSDFFAFEPELRNGAFVTAGDIDGDRKAELIFGAGPGGGPRVVVARFADIQANAVNAILNPFANFFAFDSTQRGGVRVTVKDVEGDGRVELVAGNGENSSASVRIYRASAFAGDGSAPTGTPQEFTTAASVLADGVFVG
jgi:hypothetical protein